MQATPPNEPPFWEDPDELPLSAADLESIRQALQSTQMAIARWTGGIHRPQMMQMGAVHVSPQARWYARTCDGLQQWMEHGGFAQDANLEHLQDEITVPARTARPAIDVGNVDACID